MARKTSSKTVKTAAINVYEYADYALDATGDSLTAMPVIIDATLDEVDHSEADPIYTIEAVEEAVSALEAKWTDEAPAADITLTDLMQQVSRETAQEAARQFAAAIDRRAEYERYKALGTASGENNTIQKTLNSCRAELTRTSVAQMLTALGVDPSFINRKGNEGDKLFNVYAIKKLTDVAGGVVAGLFPENAINNAVIRSMFNLIDAGYAFDFTAAKAACSNKIPMDANLRNKMVRHTVAASTAPTQASSTMEALEVLGVVNAIGKKNKLYVLRDHSPLTAALRELAA